MQILFLGFSLGITLFLVLYCGSMLFHLFSLFFRARAPFVPSSHRMIDRLPELIQPDATSVVYDLGCGDGRVLRSLRSSFPPAHYIGIENDLFPYILAKLFNWRLPSAHFIIKRKNFFIEDLSSATHVILYLFPAVMDQLLPKLERELRPGTILISFDFSFTHKDPEQILHDKQLGMHRVLVYRF